MKCFILAIVLLGAAYAIESELATEAARSPGQLLVDHINSLILSVRNEQTQHDNIYQIQKRECDDELSFRKKEVNDAVDALTRATEHRGRCQAAYASANADLIRIRTYQQIMTEQLEFITTRRNDEAATFAKKTAHINTALNLIDQAEQLVQQFANAGSSFAEVTKHFNTMFVQGAKGGFAGEYAPLLASMVELGEKQAGRVSTDDIARIRALLAALRQKLQDSVALLTDNGNCPYNIFSQENQFITEFLARKRRVEDVIALLQNAQSQLSAYIAQMQACITKEDDIINSATSKRIRNQNLFNFANDMCTAFGTEYNDSTAARRREVELLGKLRTFVEQKADEFSSYGGDVQEVFYTYSRSSDQAARDVQFLQLRANLRQRKI